MGVVGEQGEDGREDPSWERSARSCFLDLIVSIWGAGKQDYLITWRNFLYQEPHMVHNVMHVQTLLF